jgi:hypothetical protein
MASPVAVPMANPQQLGSSPAKNIESRSKCYKQLMELHNLKRSGVLTQAEYDREKKSAVDTPHGTVWVEISRRLIFVVSVLVLEN